MQQSRGGLGSAVPLTYASELSDECSDNAVADSFLSTLQRGVLFLQGWPMRAATRGATSEYVGVPATARPTQPLCVCAA